jgi:thiol:disulfide interchange protein DsbD
VSVGRFLAAAVLAVATGAHAASTVAAEHVTVSLVAERTHFVPGQTATLGLHFALADSWHVYWQNPGDSGEAPSVAWTLPSGFRAGAVEWPVPERIRIGPLANYGYEGAVLLPVALAVPADARPGSVATLSADVSWLVCRAEECIPGSAVLDTTLPVATAAASADPRWAPWFAAARRHLPAAAPVAARLTAGTSTLEIRLTGLEIPAGAHLEFFPETGGVVDNAAPQRFDETNGRLVIELPRNPAHTGELRPLAGVLTVDADAARHAYRLVAVPGSGSLALALVLAAAGGLLLNLMPCVFPVLSLKVLSFVQQSGEASGRVRAHGWAFTAGVVASFWLLAGVLLALRAGGAQLGWGFQLQSPLVVAALAALMVLLGLNLCGVFEIGLSLTRAGNAVGQPGGLAGSFWTGALATTVATPCTAPFMGAALGFALTRPALQAMLVFTALALGMAAPYLALAYVPSALRLLPRPGAWMETLKTLLAFPLFATALWLVWVLHLQAGSDAAFGLLAALLVLAFGLELWGEAQRRGGRLAWRLAAAAAVTASLPLGVTAALREPAAEAHATARDPFWAAWSAEREDELRQAGTPVFVNYTAAWCLTCQVNERLVFAAADVRDAFRQAGIAALKADWTDRDAAIARALDRHGRSGVPLYVLYAGGPATPARILPQLPTRAEVIRAIAAATTSPKEESS